MDNRPLCTPSRGEAFYACSPVLRTAGMALSWAGIRLGTPLSRRRQIMSASHDFATSRHAVARDTDAELAPRTQVISHLPVESVAEPVQGADLPTVPGYEIVAEL